MGKGIEEQYALYTYRSGEKVALNKKPDQFVVRRLPDELPASMAGAEQMSTASARVKCDPGKLEQLMTEGRTLAPTHHAYEATDTGGDFLLTDRIVVTFQRALSVEDVGVFAGEFALQIVEKISDVDYLFRLTNETGMNPIKLVVKLTEDDARVANADHDLNQVFGTAQLQLPADPRYDEQWHLHRREPSSADYDPRSSSECEEAWRLLDNFGDADVVISIADDGCQLDHPDFNGANKFAGWAYFPGTSLNLRQMGDAGATESDMYVPGQNHGTSCNGVAAAEVDGQMTVGAAPGCRLLPIRWPSSGSSLFIGDTRLRRVLDYIGTRADIMSNSWGSVPSSTWAQTTENRIDELARSGGRRGGGMVFLWAAGNSNCPISHNANQDVPFDTGWNFSTNPRTWIGVSTARNFRNDLAGRDGVLHVAALTSTARRSHYSNYGTGIGICAPTSNSHTYLRLPLEGFAITTTRGFDAVTLFGGTSSATPLTAGITALVISANPELTGLEVIQVLKETASKDLDFNGWPRTPPAIFDPNPNFDVSPIAPFDNGAFQDLSLAEGTWSPWFGHGKVDAAAAVRRALELAGESTVHVSASRTENLPVPDRSAVGVSSSVVVSEHGRIRSLSVNVDITHTYRGDLLVRLVDPDGRRAVLHRRTGGSTNNLVRTYDGSTAPDLATFIGGEVNGVWILEVFDLAFADVGTLNHWGIEAEVATDGAVRLESAPGTTIPDNDPQGISDLVSTNDGRIIADIAVDVDITHTFVGDLEVRLDGPNGEAAVLKERNVGGGTDNIQQTFVPVDAAELNRFVGIPASGQWELHVADHAGADVGKLNRWALVIR